MDNSKVPEYMRINAAEGMLNLSAADTMYKTFGEHDIGALVTATIEFLQAPRITERMGHWNILTKTEVSDGKQLKCNLKDVIGQVFHTGHFMGQLASGLWRVDHYFGKRLVTVDFVEEDPAGNYLGKAGNRWNRYERKERILLRNNHTGEKRLEELMHEYHSSRLQKSI